MPITIKEGHEEIKLYSFSEAAANSRATVSHGLLHELRTALKAEESAHGGEKNDTLTVSLRGEELKMRRHYGGEDVWYFDDKALDRFLAIAKSQEFSIDTMHDRLESPKKGFSNYRMFESLVRHAVYPFGTVENQSAHNAQFQHVWEQFTQAADAALEKQTGKKPAALLDDVVKKGTLHEEPAPVFYDVSVQNHKGENVAMRYVVPYHSFTNEKLKSVFEPTVKAAGWLVHNDSRGAVTSQYEHKVAQDQNKLLDLADVEKALGIPSLSASELKAGMRNTPRLQVLATLKDAFQTLQQKAEESNGQVEGFTMIKEDGAWKLHPTSLPALKEVLDSRLKEEAQASAVASSGADPFAQRGSNFSEKALDRKIRNYRGDSKGIGE